ncbi:unnamed protein product [Vicia faba]|uniref:Uncharacterized protein n=1 Tax=Vicia faba TaxID=3906 RepID=A0AAV0ZEL2_VICFA|nr:unnamed protein product [Vicia faba]
MLVVHIVEKSAFVNIVNSVGNPGSALDISSNVMGEVVVFKEKGKGFYDFVFSSVKDVQRVRVEYWSLNIIFANASCLGTPMCLDAATMDKEKRVTNEKHKCMGNKPVPVQKADLRKELVESVNATKTFVDNNPLLGFVDCLKTTVDGKVVSIEALHQGDLGAQGNESLCSLADIEITDQGKIDKNYEVDSDSVDTFFQEDHQEEVIVYSLLLGDGSIVVVDSNLSNFSASVIHDMQVLEIVPIEV